ncbi:MAG: hypothetical protein F6K50_31735 [Moorea sp. SIO3I7]|nr:hypothetical protein [Moorena sp. SIO3I7]
MYAPKTDVARHCFLDAYDEKQKHLPKMSVFTGYERVNNTFNRDTRIE